MKLEKPRIRALCFDVDGTLRDTDDQYTNRLATLLHPARSLFTGRDPYPSARRFIMAVEDPGTWLHSLPDKWNLNHQFERISDWLHRIGIQKESGSFLLVPGVIEMLERLSSHYPMAVVTARGQRGTQTFLEHFDLHQYFIAVASRQTCRHTKPYPDPVLWAAEKIGVQPDACLMIGDTTVDMRAGRAAGAQTVGVLCGFGERDELVRTGADMILNSTAELAEVLLDSP